MYRVKTYLTPIDLTDLERQPEYERRVVLRITQTYHGFTRISFVMRGGPQCQFTPHADEIVHVFPVTGRWPLPAEERHGRDVRLAPVLYLGALT